jgi:hypothetical protein
MTLYNFESSFRALFYFLQLLESSFSAVYYFVQLLESSFRAVCCSAGVPTHQLHLHFPRQGSFSIILRDNLDSHVSRNIHNSQVYVKKNISDCPLDKFIKL